MEKPAKKRPVARLTVSVLAVAAVVTGIAVASAVCVPAAALAQEDGGHDDGVGHDGGDGHVGGGPYGGGGHDGDDEDHDHDDGSHDDDGHTDDGGHEGGRGHGAPGGNLSAGSSVGRGGSESGGPPNWSREEATDVELGSLNVARVPDRVIDRAYAEAVAQLPAMADFYNLPFDHILTELRAKADDASIIESPLGNLSLLRDALDGTLDLSAYGITNDRTTLMPVFLGVAAEKTTPITPRTAYMVSVILEMPLMEAEAVALSERAEAVRRAIVGGDG